MERERPATARPRTALNECVKVVVRCRPLSEKERLEGHEEVVRVSSERGAVQVLNPRGQDKLFTYDAAYDETADTETIYDEMVRPLVSSVLEGFNGCVFAYGQTGTGKTHTMLGTGGEEGVVPRCFRQLWAHIEAASASLTHLVCCSYVELYLEDVRDLLSTDNKKLTIRAQHDLNGFYIPEMTSVVCKSAAEMARLLAAGARRRAAGRTDMNEHSSRSHAVFQVTVETQHTGTGTIRAGKLNLVDLAGSERQRKTQASAERLREAARINQALSALGNVISALAESSPHVPYRDSKLTRLLQDSLGGNSKTLMIANVGPAAYNYDETITTLRYAHRAKQIKNKPVRNEDPKDAKLREYQLEIERLRALVAQRRAADRPARRPPRARPEGAEAGPEGEGGAEAEAEAGSPQSEAEAAELAAERQSAESAISAERERTGALEAQIAALEARLVQGGAGKELVNCVNERARELQLRRAEIAARVLREREVRQRIDEEEETTAGVSGSFASLQQELEHKTTRLKRCLAKYAWLREEMVERREAHDSERREREAAQAGAARALRRRLLLADSLVPRAGRALVLRARWDDDADCWDLPPLVSEPLVRRPVSAAGRRRPLCEAALASRAPRMRCEQLLDLRPLPLPPTARALPPPAPRPPAPPPAQQPLQSQTSERSLRRPGGAGGGGGGGGAGGAGSARAVSGTRRGRPRTAAPPAARLAAAAAAAAR